jgi:hypothetical protein
LKGQTYPGIPGGMKLKLLIEVSLSSDISELLTQPNRHEVILDPQHLSFIEEELFWAFEVTRCNLGEHLFFETFYVESNIINKGDNFVLPHVQYFPQGNYHDRSQPINVNVIVDSTELIS